MTLPLLPTQHIVPVFGALRRDAPNIDALTSFVDYVANTWIESDMFPPAEWTVFLQDTRTNNDLEGWHYRLNQRGKRVKLPMYLMIQLLHKEAILVEIASQLIFREDLTRHQRHLAMRTNERLTVLWQEYQDGTRSARSLLNAGSHLIRGSDE